MEYTIDQQQALENMLKWYKTLTVKSAKSLLYLLDGAAGTGKTTVAKEIINILGLRKGQLAVTAPTHQAKKVIQAATDIQAITTQKLLGLRPNTDLADFDIARPQFDPLGEDMIKYYKVILIDEGSMLNKDAFDMLEEKAIRYGVRIIFMGDSYQLPPVNEKTGKIFTAVESKSRLLTVIRQGIDNPNTDLLLGIRADIDAGNSNNFNNFMAGGTITMGDKGYHPQNNVEFGKNLMKYLNSTVYEHDINYVRYLAWRNISVEKWCIGLRNAILKEKSSEFIIEGEKLIGYTTISDYRSGEIYLQNSDNYTVVHIEDDESREGIQGKTITIRDDEGVENRHFIVTPNSYEMFKQVAYEKWTDATSATFNTRGKMWGIYYTFKNNHLLLTDLRYRGMNITKDLYYASGSTVHKSQGSTFTNTAINVKDIMRNPTTSERLRLLYVAASRCRETNLLLVK